MAEEGRIACTSCKKMCLPGELSLYMRVLICDQCKSTAARMKAKGRQTLKWMETVLDEGIKNSLIEGKLQFRTPEQIEAEGDMEKKALLDHLFYMGTGAKRT